MEFLKIITGMFTESVEVDRPMIKLVVVGDGNTGCVKEISCTAFSIQAFSKNRISSAISIK